MWLLGIHVIFLNSCHLNKICCSVPRDPTPLLQQASCAVSSWGQWGLLFMISSILRFVISSIPLALRRNPAFFGGGYFPFFRFWRSPHEAQPTLMFKYSWSSRSQTLESDFSGWNSTLSRAVYFRSASLSFLSDGNDHQSSTVMGGMDSCNCHKTLFLPCLRLSKPSVNVSQYFNYRNIAL